MPYECWGDDHENLTEKVEEAKAAANSGKQIVFGIGGFVGKKKSPKPRKIRVICSKGHENVFTVEG
jgi:hypothetical protein